MITIQASIKCDGKQGECPEMATVEVKIRGFENLRGLRLPVIDEDVVYPAGWRAVGDDTEDNPRQHLCVACYDPWRHLQNY